MKFEDLEFGDYFHWKGSLWKKVSGCRARSASRKKSLGMDGQRRIDKTFNKDEEVTLDELSSSEDN